MVVGFYADELSAGEAIRSVHQENYYRSACISLSDDGHRTVQNHEYVIHLFAALLAILILIVGSYYGTPSWGHTLLAAALVYAAGLIFGPSVGLALPRSILREYARRVLPGETMIVVECESRDIRHVRSLLQSAGNVKPSVFVVRPYLSEPWKLSRTDRELLSAEQLRLHAIATAAKQNPALYPKPQKSLLHYLNRWEQMIEHVRRDLAEAVDLDQSITTSAEWLLDNAYIIRNHIQDIRRNLPQGYHKVLPGISGDSGEINLRVLRLAAELANKTDGSVTTASIYNFVSAYQGTRPLNIAELWVFPLMLRYVLIEDLAHQSLRVSRRQHDRERADFWANRLLSAAYRSPERIPEILKEISRAEPHLQPHFLIRLVGQISEEGTIFAAVQSWLQEKLDAPFVETIRTEHARQTRKQVSIANDVTSLRRMTQIDWREIFESVSLVEAFLEQDTIYSGSDFVTRDQCRRAVEEISRFSKSSEIDVAKKALQLAAEAEPERCRNVAYFLIDKGRRALEQCIACRFPFQNRLLRWVLDHSFPVYFGNVWIITAVLVAVGIVVAAKGGAEFWVSLGFALLAVWPASEVAIQLTNYWISLFIPPRLIPRMSFKSGIPDEFRTLVVVPTMLLTPESVLDEVQRLEVRYLANSEPNLHFALLTDFSDSPSQSMPEDSRLFEVALRGITELNARYGNDRFFLFHRDREWCESEQRWIGWERKRGKLEDLNRFLNDEPRKEAGSFLKAGDRIRLKGVRFVITLDADTELPHQAALRLVEAMAHPLNRPVISPDRRIVCEGYGIIQPRVITSLPAAGVSFFSSIFANSKGTDPYAQAISDVYQDLFGEGIFIGKGIYDVRAFHEVLSGRFPLQTLLSHDLIEGNYLRAGFDSTILLFENFPPKYEAFIRRQHRWIRGDWQIWNWLFSRVPDGNRERQPNPLSKPDRWKIFDNLRRSLVSPACVLVLTGGWLIFPHSVFWNFFIAAALLLPAIVPIPTRVRDQARGHLLVWRDQGIELLRGLINIALLPYHAWVSVDAIVRVWFRRVFSKRNLLQWETAQSVHLRFQGSSPQVEVRSLIIFTAAALLTLILWYRGFAVWPASALYLSLWLVSPAVEQWINTPKGVKKKREWTEDERWFVRRISRETWRYFDDLVGPESHWLPPDNSQESIRIEVAYRTSPTNIGLWLVSAMAARHSGYLTTDQVVDRLSASFDTMDSLEKFRGHLLNWYDIKTLNPLLPRYVSTVDSGNLLACLWTLDQGLQEISVRPIVGPETLDGIEDTIAVLQAACDREPSLSIRIKDEVSDLVRLCGQKPAGVRGIIECLDLMSGEFDSLEPDIRSGVAFIKDANAAGEISYWIDRTKKALADQKSVLNRYFAWAPLLIDVPEGVQKSPQFSNLSNALLEEIPVSLEEIASDPAAVFSLLERVLELIPDPPSEWVSGIRQEISKARKYALEELARINSAIQRARALQSGMSLRFLYDEDRKLFEIGHEVSEIQHGSSHYDLLASEARLSVLISVARGEVDPESWQSLGRPFGLRGGRKVLFSWSGSMFEYLMPAIFTRTFENSLLEHACREAVAAQIEYGRGRNVPWGISESAFSELDANQIYQYRAFGVPSLGLKRGLESDLVIAPYATALALMIEPLDAVENLKLLESFGLHGTKGYYEAIDFSREQSREGKKGAVVYAYMAHHQGMSFLAIHNALYNNRLQKLFHSDLRVRAAESLLYEGIPPSRIVTYVNEAEERPPARLIATPVESISGRSGSEKTPIPKTHLLSNGSYSIMVTNSGGGYSRWQGQDITRWRADTTRDHWGSYCYIRDIDTGHFWSTAYHPTDQPDPSYAVNYFSDRVEFRKNNEGIESVTEVAVSPEDDVEIRRIVLTNRSGDRRRIDLTSYSELALAPHAADRAHPAFNKLFIKTELLRDRSAFLAFRNSNTGEESRIWIGHILVSTAGLKAQFESSRAQFVGRGRSLANPAAMSRDLSNESGSVLDPILSIRKEVVLEPGERARFAVLTLAADSRDNAVRLIDKYRDLEAADRAFELAWTHSQLSFRYLRIQNEDANRFQELAAHLIYPNPGLRPGSERLRRNMLGQSRLWAFGISGDLPICALVVSDPLDLGTVRETLQAHTFWNERGLKSDLVILNTEAGGYDQPLQHQLLKLIQFHSVTTGVDKPGGVFLRSAEKLADDDLTLILSAASIVLLASRGSLARQLSSQPEMPSFPPAIAPAAWIPEDPSSPLPMPSMTFFNGIGGFSQDGHEYITYLDGDSTTPAPWINVLANPDFGALVDETGQGTAWHLNSQLNRISPWQNDPVAQDSSSGVYVRDEDTGVFWSPTASPVRESDPYRIYHGQGYTRIEHNSHGIEHNITIFVPAGDQASPLRIHRLSLRNQSSRRRRLTVTFYAEWVLGRDREETQLQIIANWDSVARALLSKNAYNTDFSGQIAFAATVPVASSYTADRAEFLGRNGSAMKPAALGRSHLSGRTGAGLDPCAALQVHVDLEPGERKDVAFLLGQSETIQDLRTIIKAYSSPDKIESSLEQTRNWWDRTLSTIQVSTPERAADFLINRWLLYQTLACRVWGRSALYQSGGAFGFRDQLQDVMALVYCRPDIAREQILRAAGHQFMEGDVQHWWHPQSGAGVRTRCSDDLLWLPYTVARYVEVTGDTKILEERVPFLEGQSLKENEMEVYSIPSISMTDGTIFEHCRRAIEKGFTSGPHGLPLIGLCDWNDGFNHVGIEGKGESVWLAWFLIEVLCGFRQLCIDSGHDSMTEMCDRRIARLESAVELHGWDGEWYRRAYFDDGSPLGSQDNAECRIDSLSQSWSVLSGSAPESRADQALKAVEDHLVLDPDRLVLLFTPPFQHSDPNPGYVRAYPPGVRENGGQYTHAAVWVAMAFARQGNGKRAVELLRMLNPIELTRSPSGVVRYKCEPYVLAGDVYSLEGHIGQGGWTWYTGSSAWMYRAWVEEVLGFRIRGNTLRIDPTIPAQWPGFSIAYVYKASSYRIHVENPERIGRGVAWVELDGQRLPDPSIPIENDGREHRIKIRLGRLKNAINY